ncbi:hypothetical protein SCORR_v1c01660 [Spiroplasma corruscae]|uniref:Uncharacterized protein n=1 Tax=Spiroplasma corruscae TaxID=216934 RepID=A0A222END4_9MOLU|nr:hypothetical protein [Spiroplasma corruscae]ASP27941.1 hypothetical protein SCORR_v1c01660 [Spiroplasma corruscae]
MKIRKIDNTYWVKNIFVDSNYLYLTNSEPNKSCFLGRIPLVILKENLKIKSDLERYFLSNPNPMEFDAVLGANSDVEIIYNSDKYIQNFFTIDKNNYITFIDNENNIKTIGYNGYNIEKIKDFLFLNKIKDDCVFKNKNKIFLLKKDDYINIDAVNIIYINNQYIIQDSLEKISIYDLNFNFVKYIEKSNEFKKIYFLNKKNILISFLNNNKTYMYNLDTNKKEIFCDFFINRAVLVNEELLIAKSNMNDNLYFIE